MGKAKQNKKGEAKALTISHPNSRKAMKLAKQTIKQAARQKTKQGYAIKRNIFGDKLLWFRDNLEPGLIYTPQMFENLIEKYLSRFEDELEQIEIKHSIGQRKGRQHASREDVINMTISREREEFNTSGIEMVNILIPQQLAIFRKWDADLNKIHNFTIRRINKTFLKNYKTVHKPPKEIEIHANNEQTFKN
uniref:Putative translation machinery-associated protein n=1 Tax=Panstrongylus megistus TaxID=65343 RepID=A0A069DWU9_9HEMI